MQLATVARVGGPLALAALLAHERLAGRGPDPALRVAGLGLWMALWWMTECVALHVTALLPLALLPLLGVTAAEKAAAAYGHDLVWLFFGAFLLGAAVEHRGLHRRLALALLTRVGSAPRRLVLGFLLAAGLVSSVLSNTATAVMLMPVAAAVAARTEDLPRLGGRSLGGRSLGGALVLAVAYGASIGGILTVIGTPPNAIFVKQAREAGLDAHLNFVTFTLATLPVAAVQLAVAWLVLARGLPRGGGASPEAGALLRGERLALGRMSPAQRRLALVFALAVLAWSTRAEMTLGSLTFPGWAKALGVPGASDATVAVAAAVALLLLPSGERDGALLPPGAVNALRWDLLLLFGGGFALGDAFQSSGLAREVGQGLAGLNGWPLPLLLLVVAFTTTALSEIATNTPLAIAVLPVLSGGAQAAGAAPLPVLLTATLAASLGFMLPVGTAPNAVAFATGRVGVRTMMRAGLWIDLAGSVAIALLVWAWSGPLLQRGLG